MPELDIPSDARCACGHIYDEHGEDGCVAIDASGPCSCFHFELDESDESDGTMIDLGGGMVVPLSELLEDDDAP